jgi:hypothetical protein
VPRLRILTDPGVRDPGRRRSPRPLRPQPRHPRRARRSQASSVSWPDFGSAAACRRGTCSTLTGVSEFPRKT